MNEIKIITIESIRGYIDKKRVAWLSLEDVAKGLGFIQVKNKKEYIRWERVVQYLKEIGFPTCGENGYIPENVFYKLCMKADNEVARKFQDKVCDEILPSIRRYGMYATDELLDNPDLIIKMTTKLKEEREKNKELESKIEEQNQMIGEFKPIKDYVDTILSSEDTITTSQIAADYGLSGIALNKILHDERIIRNVGGQWLLYKEHMNKGYTKSDTIIIKRKDGTDKSVLTTKWTQKGRLKIHEILTNLGILANIDKEKTA